MSVFCRILMKLLNGKIALICCVTGIVMLLILAALTISYTTYKTLPPNNMIIMDVGSTKTRAYLFNWNHKHRKLSPKLLGSIQCGVAINNIIHNKTLLYDYFAGCMTKLKENVGSFTYTNTYAYSGATGGIRQYCPSDPKYCKTYKENTEFVLEKIGFPFQQVKVEVLSGVSESLCGFLAVNDFFGNFEDMKDPKGTIDLGGSTLEIAFKINRILKIYPKFNIKQLKISQKRITAFLQEIGCVGTNSARLLFEYSLIKESNFNDPCLPRNYEIERQITEYHNACIGDQWDENIARKHSSVKFIGGSNVSKCIEKLGIVIGDSDQCQKPNMCLKKKIISDIKMKFYGMSTYQYGSLYFGLTENSTLKDYHDNLIKLCYTPRQNYSKYCFQYTYSYFLARNIMGLRDDQVLFINEKEIIGWPVGEAFLLKNAENIGINVRVLDRDIFIGALIVVLLIFIPCSIGTAVFAYGRYKGQQKSDSPLVR